MKNHRGSALQSVRAAMWRVFGSERLPTLRSNTDAATIVAWKSTKQVNDCFCLLYELNHEGVFWVSIIARVAFTEVAAPTLSHEHCAFTLAVCDIFLNPRSKGIICTEKRMKYRIERYLVNIF
jgi:hypothetical protein